MIALALAAALAAVLQPDMAAAPAPPSNSAPPANGAPAVSSVSAADLQRWIDTQPEVRAYQQLRMMRGVQPPPADAFRRQPTLPRDIACQSSRTALSAAVRLFQASDEGKISPVSAAFTANGDIQGAATLDDQQKQLLQDRARQYEQAAGEFEPACLG